MVDYATLYAEKVLSGDILVSEKNYAVAERHLNDLKHPPEGCYWDAKKANKAIKFIEMLPDPKTNQPMPLMLFQKFIVGSIYGWRREGGFRRYTKGYISMARKQGQSLIVAGMSLNELLFGQYPKFNRQIYVSSSTYKQAQTIFKMASQQIKLLRSKSDFIRKSTDVRKTDLAHIDSTSVFEPLSNNPDAVDGKDPTVAILDELASMPDDEMYSRFKTGMTLQKNPLTLLISTAGDNLNSQMYQEYKYITKILSGEVKADNYFVYCAEMDSEEEVNDESKWIKAMPLLESDEHRDTILRNIKSDIQDELEKGTSFHKILIKNFNLWQANKEDSLININEWEAIEVNRDNYNLYGKDVYIGVDLSRLDDLTSVGFIFPTDDGDMLIDSHSFIGLRTTLEQKSKRDKINYEKLINTSEAEVTTSESGMIDYKRVIEYIFDIVEEYRLNVKALCYDPWNAQSFVTTLESMVVDWPLIEVGQSFRSLSQPIKQFRMWVAEKTIKHFGNNLLTIAVNNAVLIYDGEDNVKINKKMNRQKIDPIISVITAFSEASMHEFEVDWSSIYENEEFGF
ncbi:phage terminase family protein [Staphylococcus sp. IVB6181]|uniref:terminase large subunit n=1 Tax=Staphylococcus sp. IVB6181 TaxID=2929481 RepID=UPI0021D2E80B|nr:phage terminase family protein [Staphylococcus sp. IVB6181]UXV35965.1 phage terminase family protein [Staphylococcus sp. IVB6181]